ncbi:MAG: hypothetical protein CM1200mP1_12800 [Candidatus Neomarinimicrobiota bacterium]|nr:MAG: hypothetical protein CM1200mP1_12800 [Candidatus Neomarinimicrobiota bacterium]
MDGTHYDRNEKMSKEFIKKIRIGNLSLQTHKLLGFP